MRPAAKSGDGSQGPLRAQINCGDRADQGRNSKCRSVGSSDSSHSQSQPSGQKEGLVPNWESMDQGPNARPCMEWYIYTTAQGAMENHGLSLSGALELMGKAVPGGP